MLQSEESYVAIVVAFSQGEKLETFSNWILVHQVTFKSTKCTCKELD